MTFQTGKTFVHLQNKNYDFFLIKSESSVTVHRQQGYYHVFKVQEGTKNIVKIVHVTSAIEP